LIVEVTDAGRAAAASWPHRPVQHTRDIRPAVGGMAAAWPYCDAVVSAHSLDALDELLSALS
jgi:uncharacterized protein